LRLLTGRHPPSTPRSKRLLSDSMSNIFIFITGHSGEEFIKFQDWEEITSNDIADAFAQMHKQGRYRKIFWMSDTCQAATLQNKFYSPDIIGIGSSARKENSYSHHVDSDVGVAIIDRFTYYSLEYMRRMKTTSTETIENFKNFFQPRLLHSNPELRSDLFSRKPSEVLLTEFWASRGRMRFQNSSMILESNPVTAEINETWIRSQTSGQEKEFRIDSDETCSSNSATCQPLGTADVASNFVEMEDQAKVAWEWLTATLGAVGISLERPRSTETFTQQQVQATAKVNEPSVQPFGEGRLATAFGLMAFCGMAGVGSYIL